MANVGINDSGRMASILPYSRVALRLPSKPNLHNRLLRAMHGKSEGKQRQMAWRWHDWNARKPV